MTLHAHIPDHPLLLQGDSHQLERMAVNLVGDAVKLTPGGGRVDVRLDVEGEDARITVEDTGIGITFVVHVPLVADETCGTPPVVTTSQR